MESPTENPTRAAEYLKELNNIIETQQELLEMHKTRIEELELQVSELCSENACLKDQYQRHLATCRLLQQGNSHATLGAIKENITQENYSRLLQLPYGLGRGEGREPCVLQNTTLPSHTAS
ncbi:unnamed protein product [Oncorhynchus mykiss]|uniref:Uncharacterized protein n=1 Tax=Oncorhynchus mykiss TaxID=8022 RepID=A0A060X6S2_ONCMY|nr:unnamed protein product [Oncorhynchus mykiss]